MELSNYFNSLSIEEQEIYKQKISIINIDPYMIKFQDCSSKIEDFPKVLYPDIFMYLVYTKSKYTADEMKAYKSLEAYNQAACGWVRQMSVKRMGLYSLILSKVGIIYVQSNNKGVKFRI